MPRSNPLLGPKPPAIWSYSVAVFSVAGALTISRWPALHLQDAPVSLFLCAVMLSAWFGGIWPGLLAAALSALTFYYFFLPPIYSLAAKPDEIPRLLVFMVSALFVGSLSVAQRSATESLRRARDDLKETVQELRSTNEALEAESRERERAEESLRRSEGYLAEAQRLTHTGSWVWQVAGRDAVHLSDEWYRVYGFDLQDGIPTLEQRLQRIHPEDRGKWQEAIDRAVREKSDYDVEFRILLPGATVKYIHTHQRQYLPALAYARSPRCGRSTRGGHENRERRNACGRNYQANSLALQKGSSATGVGGRKRSYPRDDRSSARRGNAILRFSADRAGDRQSPGSGGSRAIATGADEPHDEWHRRDEGSEWDARIGRQVAEDEERRGSRVRQRYRCRTSAAAGGSDVQRVFYNETSWDRHGTSHQPLYRRIAWRALVGCRQLSARRKFSFRSTDENRGKGMSPDG